MLTFCSDIPKDSPLYIEYKEKYQSFIEWYKEAYSSCKDLFLQKIKEKSEKGKISEAHKTTLSYNSIIEALLKLILSKYSKCCDDHFLQVYGINLTIPDDKRGNKWIECKFDLPILIELLARVFENRKISPKFDLKSSGDNRYVRNGVTHQGDNSIPLTSIRTYNNIREMLIFLDEDVSDDLPIFQFPKMFEFQDFVSDCDGLNLDDYTSILLVDSVHDISKQKKEVVANLKWDYVIDFDGYSSSCGLRSCVNHETNDIIRLRNGFIKGKVNWIGVGDYQLCYNQYNDFAIPGKNLPSKKLLGEDGKKYEKVLEELFDKVIETALDNYNVILIVALTDDIKIINKILRSLVNADDNSGDFFRLVHVGLTNKSISDDYDDYREYYHFFYSPISQVFDAFYEYRKNYMEYEVKDKISQYLLPTTENKVEISEQLRNKLARNFDVLYIGREKLYDSSIDENAHSFYRGGIASWDIINNHQIPLLFSEKYNTIKSDIIAATAIQESRYRVFQIVHTPGFGGTTVARQIAWSLHEKYPVLSVNSYSPDISDMIKDLYDSSDVLNKTPIILLADDTINDLDALSDDIIKHQRRCCLIISTRKNREIKKARVKTYHYNTLSSSRIDELKDCFGQELLLSKNDEGLVKRRNENFNRVLQNFLNPFMIGLYYLEDDFNVETYIQKAITNKTIDTAVACVAICDKFGCKNVSKAIVNTIAQINIRDALQNTYPSYANLICIIDDNAERCYRFQHVILRDKYLEAYKDKYYSEYGFDMLYFELAKELINSVCRYSRINDNHLDLLINLLIKNKATSADDSDDWFDAKVSQLVYDIRLPEKQREILLFLAESFIEKAENIQEKTDSGMIELESVDHRILQLVSHAYSHLAKLLSRNYDNPELAESYINEAIRFMPSKDPVIYHMSAESMWQYLKKRLYDDVNFTENLDNMDIEVKRIVGYYDSTSEIGSPEYGYIGKLKIYSNYFDYLCRRFKIQSEETLREKLSQAQQEFRLDFCASFDYLDSCFDLDESLRSQINERQEKYNKMFVFGNEDKSAEYYQNRIEQTKSIDARAWKSAVSGLVSSRINQAKTKMKETGKEKGDNYYLYLPDRVLENLFNHINEVLSVFSDVSSYADYCKTTAMFYHYVQLSKILKKPVSEVLNKVAGKWTVLEKERFKRNYSPEPYYHNMVILYLQTLNGITLSLEKAHNMSSKMREMYKDKMFRETGRSSKKICDIVLETGNGMSQLMNTSYCGTDEAIMVECSHRGVYPKIFTAVFEKSITPDRLALLNIIEPKSLQGTKVYLDLGLSYGNDIDSSCEGKNIDIVLGFTYEGARALSHYARLSNSSKRLDIHEIVNSFSTEKQQLNSISTVHKKVAKPGFVRTEMSVEDSIKFHSSNLNTNPDRSITDKEEQSVNLLPNLNQKIVEVTIESCSKKTANAKLEHEGNYYPVLINSINKAQRKRLKIGAKTKVKIVSSQKQYTARLQS